ncbi:MAG: UbiA-like polyprenyltransferase [Thermoleophilia bacterium]
MTGGLHTSGRAPAAGRELVPALLNLVRFQHTVFALPFAVAGALLARHEWPRAAVLAWVLVAMVGARSLAMAINRLVDRHIDAANPRTAGRELPSGRLTAQQVWWFSAVSLAVLLVAVSQLPRITWWLWPIPVAGFVLYPYTKRFSWLCHLVLGLVIGLAPVGGWIAVTGHFAASPVLMGLAVAFWIGGFDIIYALLDLEFDRAHGVRSVPARFGPAAALWTTRGMHVLAVLALAAAGETAGVGTWYRVGVAVCAAILVFENLHVHPQDRARIQAAFGRANALLALVFFVAVVAEVSVPSPL